MIEAMRSATDLVGKRDVAIAVALSLLGLLSMYTNVEDEAVRANVLAMPLILGVTVPLVWRRAAPIAALIAALAGLLVHLAAFGTEVIRCGTVLPTAFLLVFAAGVQLELRRALIGLALGLGLIGIEGAYFLGSAFVPFAALAAGVWGIGRVAQSRGRMAEALRTQTRELRQTRDERARLDVATDRARLSRELNVLLQRRLGELARLADEGAHLSDAATATATLVDIERQSRRTLDEMRAVVGVLRLDPSDASTAPPPTLTHLEALLVRAKGTDARLRVEGSPRVLPAGVELSAYRIVEHLLAALEDAAGVEVCVRFADDALELAVSGSARRGAKAAVAQARERTKLQRGTLETRTCGGRSHAVVWLPLSART
jgi:hypothetical protein